MFPYVFIYSPFYFIRFRFHNSPLHFFSVRYLLRLYIRVISPCLFFCVLFLSFFLSFFFFSYFLRFLLLSFTVYSLCCFYITSPDQELNEYCEQTALLNHAIWLSVPAKVGIFCRYFQTVLESTRNPIWLVRDSSP